VDHRYSSYEMQWVAATFPEWSLDRFPISGPLDLRKRADPSRLYFASDAEVRCPDLPMRSGESIHFQSAHGGGFNYVTYSGALRFIPASGPGNPRTNAKPVK
jgi:hypothetical protein